MSEKSPSRLVESGRTHSLLRFDCCWHKAGVADDDVTCCVCDRNPCGHRSPEDMLAHEDHAQLRLRRSFDRELAYAIEHGHREPDPFGNEAFPPECRKCAAQMTAPASTPSPPTH